MLVHARALLSGRGRGRTAVVQADVRDTEAIIADERVRELIDFSEPLAVMLVSVLQFVPDREPQDIVAPLRDAMPSGGYLVVSHPTQDFRTSQVNEVAGAYNRAKAPAVARRKSEIERVFDGFELLEPGVVQTPLWRPDGEVTPDLDLIWMYGAVGRKP